MSILESLDKYDIFAIRNFLISIGLLFLFCRKRKNTFLYISLALILYVSIYIIRPSLIEYHSVIVLVALLGVSFVLSLQELLLFERQGKSFADFVALDKVDYWAIGFLFLLYFVFKISL